MEIVIKRIKETSSRRKLTTEEVERLNKLGTIQKP